MLFGVATLIVVYYVVNPEKRLLKSFKLMMAAVAALIGSDQVWNYNLTEHDMHYFLPEIDDSVEKIAYAASTGMNF